MVPDFAALYRSFRKSITIRYSALTFYLNHLSTHSFNQPFSISSALPLAPILACTQYCCILNMTNYNVKSHWSKIYINDCLFTRMHSAQAHTRCVFKVHSFIRHMHGRFHSVRFEYMCAVLCCVHVISPSSVIKLPASMNALISFISTQFIFRWNGASSSFLFLFMRH